MRKLYSLCLILCTEKGDFLNSFYDYPAEQVVQELQTNTDNGLNQVKVDERLLQYGSNEFEKTKPESVIKLILSQFKDVSVIVLLFAAVVSLFLAIHEGTGFVEPLVIFSVIVLNTILSVSQERSANRAIDALQALNAPSCTVLRDGILQDIPSAALVPGDILSLEIGALIPADARLIESVSLQVEESALTGESVPSEKDATALLSGHPPIGDQENMVFSGCMVVAGRAKAVVVETGMNTEMGKIAGLLNRAKRLKTPLQRRLDRISQVISFIAIASAILLFCVGMLQNEAFWHMLLVAVSLAVAAVPETLSLIVTLTLSHGVQQMVKHNALIRQLQAVETLGSVSIICSDKTGTLTQNRMFIKRLWASGEEPIDQNASFSVNQEHFLNMLALVSNATSEVDEEGHVRIIGDPTESAIIHLLDKKNINKSDIEEKYPRISELPFDSDRKLMSTIHKQPDGKYFVLTKGAFDRLPLQPISPEKMQEAQFIHDSFAEQALRVISLGYKVIDELPDDVTSEALESDLEFMGLIGMIDPPRPESALAVAQAKKAGIRTIMITGDHVATASAIASEIGILKRGDAVMSGEELALISDDELCDSVENFSVYARVSPEDKIRIVEAWQQNDHVVAMTGDGVNDAPALRDSDVGIAMGQAGTDVAKSAADMILTDDNFATIIEAVRQGRYVFANIRKTVYFLLTCNFSEILMMLVAQIIGWGAMMTPVQLLFINIIGDGIPGLSLAKETPDARIMDRKPIGRDESFFANGMRMLIAKQAFVFSVVSWIGFYIGKFVILSPSFIPSHKLGQTMAFLIVGWTSVLHIFTVRSRKSIFKVDYHMNPQLTISAIAMLLVFALLLIIHPVGQIFGLVPISWKHWLIAIGLSIIPTIVAEIGKWRDNQEHEKEYKTLLHRRIHRKDSTDY